MSHDSFIAQIVAEPWSSDVRLIYSDWLEDQGDPEADVWRRSLDRLDALPPHVESLLPVVRDHWLSVGRQTGPCDREKAFRVAHAAYQVAGLKPPDGQLWLESPLQGAVAAASIVKSKVRDQVWDRVRDQVWDQVRAQVRDRVWDQVRDQVWDQVGDRVWDQVYRCGYGQHDAPWLAFYSTFDLAGLSCCEKLRPLMELAHHCSWWWPFDGLVIFTERPIELVMASGKLKLIRYSDGFEVQSNG